MLARFFSKTPLTSNSLHLSSGEQLPDKFNHENSNHLEIIAKKTAIFKQAQTALRNSDTYAFWSTVFSGGSYIASYVFPLVWFSLLSGIYTGYNIGARDKLNQHYKAVFDDLIKVYIWCMGKDTGLHWNKFLIPELQELILTLGPWVSKDTICTWEGSDLQQSKYVILSEERNDLPEDFKAQLKYLSTGAQATAWNFPVYGENGIKNFKELLPEGVASLAKFN